MHHHSWKVKTPPLLFHTDCQPRHPQTPGPGGPRARKPQPRIEAEGFPTFAPRLRILPPDGSWLPPPGPWPRGRRRPVTLPECRQLPPWPASPVFLSEAEIIHGNWPRALTSSRPCLRILLSLAARVCSLRRE